MVHVGVDDHSHRNVSIGLQAADGNGDVVNGAEAFTVVGVGVMEAAA